MGTPGSNDSRWYQRPAASCGIVPDHFIFAGVIYKVSHNPVVMWTTLYLPIAMHIEVYNLQREECMQLTVSILSNFGLLCLCLLQNNQTGERESALHSKGLCFGFSFRLFIFLSKEESAGVREREC